MQEVQGWETEEQLIEITIFIASLRAAEHVSLATAFSSY